MKKYLFNFAQEGKSLIIVTMALSLLSLILYYRFEYDIFLTNLEILGASATKDKAEVHVS